MAGHEWDFGDGDLGVVKTYISYLRRKLDALGPSLIETRRGIGYILRPPGSVVNRGGPHRRARRPRPGRWPGCAKRLCRLETLGLSTTVSSTISMPAHCSSDQESSGRGG